MDEIDWATRATAWELAALSFRYPGPELEGAVASGEWAEAAREIAGALGLALPEGFGAGASAEGLRPEATRLFVGAPEPAVSPYEGVWRAADDGVQALLFVNPHSMEVERFMRGCGLGRPEGTNEPLDHVATECELMEHLALRAAGAEPPGGAPAGADLPGGSPEAAYGAFLEGHARTWMPRFAERVAAETRAPFYRDAATFLGALVAQ
ncbi:molecular chaperone [Gordonibacter urolithinfaciens]|uniref:Molecular chaperone TorD n=5 Tax=Gordonibacter urolithinfaciens TaxID=1335613 RepID=A0A423UNB5_9ACTN|nr:molecular chaperone TorD family protein [Gordonibacter urolithinfaciens]MVM54184.1 molecular chaperone TorD [Gordonibacter urolithinfaciens]MVN14440.1 molecular chaperone TorD [Gordonibacter urolithinfaciens]MVN37769.1 molecular chaperone TorD [Gordonibacter urolithinfaciens]MVN55754.1 molecular chaperone TorD [Gordonibacter urolithinfaciens]ROT91661.1 molecular chaperone TorD [Gordonibacter urolithinfaciens]